MPTNDPSLLSRRFLAVRARTEALAAPLSPEDQQIQSMPDCSPTKWHRAHTTWFFETFVLALAGEAPAHEAWGHLFNSYYEAVGPRHARPQRGMITRPTADEVGAWRARTDERVVALLARARGELYDTLAARIELGLAHEEQHQELLLTDALHALSQNPLRPAYRPTPTVEAGPGGAGGSLRFHPYDGGLVEIGARPGGGFSFDNEHPRHRVYVAPFTLAERPITVGDVAAFAADGGYRTATCWLSEGWAFAQAHGLDAPGYARQEGGEWRTFGLDGDRALHPDEPAAFLSYYEADAIARAAGARLPTEAEWELAAAAVAPLGNLLGDDPAHSALRPLPPALGAGVAGLYGDVWEWTSSPYAPYPRYRPAEGAIGEYNGKFMVNQVVLRGGSCFTPAGHVRATYRNFWHPPTRFQVTGARLARDA